MSFYPGDVHCSCHEGGDCYLRNHMSRIYKFLESLFELLPLNFIIVSTNYQKFTQTIVWRGIYIDFWMDSF